MANPIGSCTPSGTVNCQNKRSCLDVCIQSLKSEDEDVLYQAIRSLEMLAQANGPGQGLPTSQAIKMVNPLIGLLKHDSASIRAGSLEALSGLSNRRDLPASVKDEIADSALLLLGDKSESVRSQVALVLMDFVFIQTANCPPERKMQVINILIKALGGKDQDTKRGASCAISANAGERTPISIKKKLVPCLVTALSDELSEVRYDAVRALIAMKAAGMLLQEHKEMVPALTKMMDDNVREVYQYNAGFSFLRPVYEPAILIGEIAKEARKTNNQQALTSIKDLALKEIEQALLKKRDYQGCEQGAIIQRVALGYIKALVDIGDASAIETINASDNFVYGIAFSKTVYSIENDKKIAVEYLLRQSQSVKFIDPPYIDYGRGL